MEDKSLEFDFKTISFIDEGILVLDEIESSERKEYIIEVDFKGSRKGYYLNSKAISLKVGDFVIVDCDNGEDMGNVSALINKNLRAELTEDGFIIRKSNHIDARRLEENRTIEDKILIDARKQAKHFNLDMKFIDIEYKFDRKKLVFYFTADGRVDFRELVKVFAAEYRTRIELRQIGVRDEAQRIGGIGICGRELCCSKFLKNFVSINVAMARDQNLFVKPEKFSGACGKLMCCLKYEHEFYLSAKKGIPEIGTMIKTTKGVWYVNGIDVFKKTITLSSSGNDLLTYSFEQVGELIKLLSPNSIISSNNGFTGNQGNGTDDHQPKEGREGCPTCINGQCTNACKVSDIDILGFKKQLEQTATTDSSDSAAPEGKEFSLKNIKKDNEKIEVKKTPKSEIPDKIELTDPKLESKIQNKDDNRPRKPFHKDQQRHNNTKQADEVTPNSNRRPDNSPKRSFVSDKTSSSDLQNRTQRDNRDRKPFDKNRSQKQHSEQPVNHNLDKPKRDV